MTEAEQEIAAWVRWYDRRTGAPVPITDRADPDPVRHARRVLARECPEALAIVAERETAPQRRAA